MCNINKEILHFAKKIKIYNNEDCKKVTENKY